MTDTPKLACTLQVDSAGQERFESYRTERVRKGKRWVHKDVTDYSWSKFGRVHLNCPVTGEWNGRRLGFWLIVKLPVAPPPTEHYRHEELAARLQVCADDIFKALATEAHWDLTSPIEISLSVAPCTPGTAATLTREVPIGTFAGQKLDEWVKRLQTGEAKFTEAREFILKHVSEHSAYYEHIAPQLRAAAHLLDACESGDASPHLWMKDSYPTRISRYMEDLLSRKSPTSHGFKVAFHQVYGGAFSASFPIYWRGWPPF